MEPRSLQQLKIWCEQTSQELGNLKGNQVIDGLKKKRKKSS